MEDVIHWVTAHKEENPPNRKVSHSHPDPTADEAISKVIREEGKKKHKKRNQVSNIRNYQAACTEKRISSYSSVQRTLCRQIYTGRGDAHFAKGQPPLLSAGKCQPDRSVGKVFFPGV